MESEFCAKVCVIQVIDNTSTVRNVCLFMGAKIKKNFIVYLFAPGYVLEYALELIDGLLTFNIYSPITVISYQIYFGLTICCRKIDFKVKCIDTTGNKDT